MDNKKSIIKQCVGITSATVLMTMTIPAALSHAAVQPSSIMDSAQVNNQDEVRQVTRTIRIDDPYKGMQTIKQTVTFKKNANKWQVQAPGIWKSFYAPNYDEFKPDILQVRAQRVTPDDANQTVMITYHQYKIPERELLAENHQTFYAYDTDFNFLTLAWNTKRVKVGQWFEIPPAPKGFEICYPEVLPKRLKLYSSRQEPYRILIRPVQEIIEHKEEDHVENPQDKDKVITPPEEKLTTTGSQTDKVTSSDSDTQTEVIEHQDHGQQTEQVKGKDEGTQAEQEQTNSGTQTTNPETNIAETQTESETSTDQETQTQPIGYQDAGQQTEESRRKDKGVQTEHQEKNAKDASSQTENNELKDTATQTDMEVDHREEESADHHKNKPVGPIEAEHSAKDEQGREQQVTSDNKEQEKTKASQTTQTEEASQDLAPKKDQHQCQLRSRQSIVRRPPHKIDLWKDQFIVRRSQWQMQIFKIARPRFSFVKGIKCW